MLDMDETLCYCFYPSDAAGFMYQPDIKGDAIMEFPEQKILLYVYKRPGLDEFLEYLGDHFDPVLYSSGIPEYVNRVADVIDPKGVFRARYSQVECSYGRLGMKTTN
jgi:RNA polymerase II subunit A small phosphatase-like protein